MTWERPPFHSWVGRIPWRRTWQPTSVFLPGESHGQRSLVGHGPYSRKESNMCKLPNGRDWWWENLCRALVGRALLNKALIQLSADGWGCTSSLVVFWPRRPNPQVYGLCGQVNFPKRVYTKGDIPRQLLPVPSVPVMSPC